MPGRSSRCSASVSCDLSKATTARTVGVGRVLLSVLTSAVVGYVLDVAGVGIVVGVEAKADGEFGLKRGAGSGDVADAVVGDVEVELPIGGEVGDGDEDFTALDRSSDEAVADVPGEHAAGDRAADDQSITFVDQELLARAAS